MTDCLVVSQVLTVARHARRFNLKSKPADFTPVGYLAPQLSSSRRKHF